MNSPRTQLPITGRHPKALGATPPEGAPGWIEGIDNPYLHGLFAPTTLEVSADTLRVRAGEIPADLQGAYFRNGPNARYAPKNRYHWFDGDGMVHGIWFEDGQARYANRYVQTEGLVHEAEAERAIWPGVLGPFDFSLPGGPLKDTANTDLLARGGDLLALWYESGRPYRLDPRTLETRGVEDFGGRLRGPISAHSKLDPETGELLFFSYGDRAPYMRCGLVRPDGTVHETEITLPGPRRPHDLGVTERYAILHDFPVFFDEELFKQTGKRIPLFHREVPTRYGVIPRAGSDGDVKWFECEPCYMLHVVNCYEEGDWVVMLGCRTTDPTLRPEREDGKLAAMLSGLKLQANLYRWRLNMVTGEVQEGPLCDLNAEFPTTTGNWLGRRKRYSYHQVIPYEIPATFEGLAKYDLLQGTYQRFDYGPGVFGSEAPFAPRSNAPDAPEDDGYVLSFMTDVSDWSSSCWIWDARDVTEGPIAEIELPIRIPAGFHATWVPGADLAIR